MSFQEQLQIGKTGESLIASYFKKRGYNVLPVYDKTDVDFKGPQLFLADGNSLVAPDMLVFKGEKVYWVEAKHKSAFTWYRKSKQWLTGIDVKHFEQYLKVSETTPWPVWILFLHRNGTAKDTPPGMISPTGLFGAEIQYLKIYEHHRHENWGKGGMVYWAHESLKLIDSMESP